MTSMAYPRRYLPRRTLTACCVALFLASPLAAQEILPKGEVFPSPVRRLTLQEAQQLALANNKSLILARLNVEEKQHVADGARKDYFPKLLGNSTYFHFDDNLGQVVTVRSGQLGILPPGARTINVAVVNENAELSTIMVAQPITQLIAVNAAVQIARADRNSAQAQLDKGTQDLLSGIAQAYEGLLGALRIQAALETQVGMLEQAVGANPSPDLRIGLLQTRQGLLQVRGQAQELTDQLCGLLDLQPGTRLELVDPLPADPPIHSPDQAAQLATDCSFAVRDASQSIAKAEAALQVAKMAYLPDVNVIGGYANQTSASYIQPNIGYVGVSASYTFWDWGKRRDLVCQRETDVSMAHQNLQVTIDKTRAEARRAFYGFQQSRDAFRLAGQMVRARQDAERAAVGPAIAEAKVETSKAQLDWMKAEISYRVANAQLSGLLGH